MTCSHFWSDQLIFLYFVRSSFHLWSDQLTIIHTVLNNLVTTECDIFTGQWVPDSSGPFYTSESCKHIDAPQNCLKNGRPDSDYVHWRWKPRDCELPKFDPRKFLDLMRNKSFAFIGDSIQRNHQQSLLCTLSQVKLPNFRTLQDQMHLWFV